MRMLIVEVLTSKHIEVFLSYFTILLIVISYIHQFHPFDEFFLFLMQKRIDEAVH